MPRRRRARTSAEQLEFTNDAGELLGPFAAPFARDVGAIVGNLNEVTVARAVVEVCCEPDAAGGLTLAEIATRVGPDVAGEDLERRLKVFVGLGMLRPYEDRRGAARYVLDPRALAGVQVVERLSMSGGVSELLVLLDRTAAAIQAATATHAEVRAALERARLFFTLFADTLTRLARHAPIAELYAEVRNHEHQRLLETIDTLTALVADVFPDLEPAAHDTLLEAQRYDRCLGVAAERVVAEGGAARDFTVLTPETWRTAAIHAPWEQLAEVGDRLVFDRPAPTVFADQLFGALERWRPRRTPRELPPEPDIVAGPDPLSVRRAERAARRRRLTLQGEGLLQDEDERDLTSTVRSLPWSGASSLLADVFAADRDPEVPLRITTGDGLLADRELEVAWCATPITLARALESPLDTVDSNDEPARQRP